MIKIALTITIFSFLSFAKSQAQTIKQLDSIVYGDYGGSEFSAMKERYAKICADYIQKYYAAKAIPLVYLDIRVSQAYINDTMEFAYDNFYGNVLDNDTYDRSGKYYQPGVRIKLRMKKDSPESLLKLLDYAINNLDVLKERNTKVSKLDYYDRPKSPVLPKKKVARILHKRTSKKIKDFLMHTTTR